MYSSSFCIFWAIRKFPQNWVDLLEHLSIHNSVGTDELHSYVYEKRDKLELTLWKILKAAPFTNIKVTCRVWVAYLNE